jgi:HEAT repeat protein
VLTLIALVAGSLAPAVCSAWAQGTNNADVAARVQIEIQRLKDKDLTVRAQAAIALGDIGWGAKEAFPALIPALTAALAKDTDATVREYAALGLVQIAEATRDAKRTGMIEQLAQCAQILEARSFREEATKVRTAVDVFAQFSPLGLHYAAAQAITE